MSTERLAPNSILTSTGCTGTVSDLTNDPDSGTDGNWVTADSDTTDIVLEVDFPDVSGPLAKGSGLQEIRARVAESLIGNTPDNVTMAVYEGGSLVTTLYNVGSPSYGTGGAVISGTWDAADLSTQSATADVRVRITCTADTSPPPQVCSLDVDSIEWNPTYVGGTVLPDNKLEAPALLIPGVAPAVRCRLDRAHPLAADTSFLFGPNHGVDLGRQGLKLFIPNNGKHTLEGWDQTGESFNLGSYGPKNFEQGAIIIHAKFNGVSSDSIQSFFYTATSGNFFYFYYHTTLGGVFRIWYQFNYGSVVGPVNWLYTDMPVAWADDHIFGVTWHYNIGARMFCNGVLGPTTTTTTNTGSVIQSWTNNNTFNLMNGVAKSLQHFDRMLSDDEMSKITLDPYCALVPE